MNKHVKNPHISFIELYAHPTQVNLWLILAIIGASFIGILLYFILNSALYLFLALLLNISIALYWFYSERNYRKLSSSLLHQLATEILDTGVILFDMHDRSISCGVWAPTNGYTLSCRVYSTNKKYESLKTADLSLDEQYGISIAIRERAQTFESAKIKINNEDLISKLEAQWDWRLVTPIIDAIDRLIVIGVLVIDGKGNCRIEELNKLGLDKAATMLAFQICEVMSILRRAA